MLSDQNNSIANHDDYILHVKKQIEDASKLLKEIGDVVIAINRKILKMEDSKELQNFEEASNYSLEIIIKNLKRL